MENYKKCNTCLQFKPLDSFYKSPGGRAGYRPGCKACYLDKQNNVERKNRRALEEIAKRKQKQQMLILDSFIYNRNNSGV